MNYKDVVLSILPQLIFLDDVKLLEEDQDIMEIAESDSQEAEVIFTCHKITGLPSPPKMVCLQ